MTNTYPVIALTVDQAIRDETLGTKNKFWFEHAKQRWLFKESRPNTGEDWSEKLAYEIARLLNIPAAKIELALCDGKRGTASLSFVDRDKSEDLVHGNEILAGQVFGYDAQKIQHQSDHTIENIRVAFSKLFLEPTHVDEIFCEFAEYLVLDALVGNVDRHHENWALLAKPVIKDDQIEHYLVRLSPTYDHASSLGRELSDEAMERRLKDQQVGQYVRKGRGAIYLDSTVRYGPSPLYLVETRSALYPQYFQPILGKLKSVPISAILSLVDPLPADRLSETGRRFVKAFLEYTYEQLCKIQV